MKICLVSDYLPYIHDTWSGAELVSWKLGELLSEREHSVFYISLNNSAKNTPKNVFCISTPVSKVPFIGKNILIDIKSVLSIFCILREEKPDIVHILGRLLFMPAAVCALLLRIPYVFTALDYYIVCPRNMLIRSNGELCRYNHGRKCAGCFLLSERPIVKKIDKFTPRILQEYICILRKWSIDFLMKRAKKIITFSQTSRNRLLSYGYRNDHVEVIYHYKFETASSSSIYNKIQNGRKILFVGTFSEHKGLHIIIKAMKDVIKQIPDVKLQIIGKGKYSYINYIDRLIREYSINENVDFLGHKDNKDVLRLIKEVDLVVVPEQWYSEFGPVILIEAKLSGKPVVASRIGSIPEFVRDGVDGILAEYNNSGDFSKGIVELLKNPDIANSMGNNISENINKITQTMNVLNNLERLYLE